MKFGNPVKSVPFTYDPKGTDALVHLGHVDAADAVQVPILRLSDIQASTIALWMGGQYQWNVQPSGGITYPIRIEWKLWLGIGCLVDDDPFTGVTIIKDQADFNSREGLLFQVDCRVATTAWLTARIIDNMTGLLNVTIRTIFWPLSGRPELIMGSAIG